MTIKTAYFVLPALDSVVGLKTNHVKLAAEQSFKVIKDLKGKVTEVTCKSLISEIEKPPVAIKDVGTEEHIKPEFELQGRIIGEIADKRKIIHAIVPKWLLKEVRPYLGDDVSDDPLDAKNLDQMGLKAKFVGYLRKDVLKAFPELEGEEKTGEDEKGIAVMVDKLEQHTWLGE